MSNVAGSLTDSLPVGSTIEEVEGLPLATYLERHVLPDVFASAPHSRRISAIEESHSRGYGLLVRPAESAVEIVVQTPAGRRVRLSLARDRFTAEREWSRPPESARRPPLKFEWLDSGIAYVALNTFSQERIVAEVDSLMPELREAAGVVLDLRDNGGGSDFVAVEVLAPFGTGWRHVD